MKESAYQTVNLDISSMKKPMSASLLVPMGTLQMSLLLLVMNALFHAQNAKKQGKNALSAPLDTTSVTSKHLFLLNYRSS
jgi:hypothetical protein